MQDKEVQRGGGNRSRWGPTRNTLPTDRPPKCLQASVCCPVASRHTIATQAPLIRVSSHPAISMRCQQRVVSSTDHSNARSRANPTLTAKLHEWLLLLLLIQRSRVGTGCRKSFGRPSCLVFGVSGF